MDQSYFATPSTLCYGCMSKNAERRLHPYFIQNVTLRAILQCDQIILCYLCRRVAQQAEQFMYNVQYSQSWFATTKQISDLQLINIKANIRPLVNLSSLLPSQEDILELSGIDAEGFCTEELCTTVIKPELEDDYSDDVQVTGESQATTQSQQHKNYIIEDSSSEYDSESEMCEYDRVAASKYNKYAKAKKGTKVEIITLSKQRFKEEMAERAKEEKYLDAPFKCTDCVVYFRMKDTYERHMQRHQPSNGKHECELCKQRIATMEQLTLHSERHLTRFKCRKCGLVGRSSKNMHEHYNIVHEGRNDNICMICKKLYSCKLTLRNHIKAQHTQQERVKCKYCDKTFKSKNSLPQHYLAAHREQVSGKTYNCKICNKAFMYKTTLKYHTRLHSNQRDYYCVECNKSFVTEKALNIHLKTTTAHTNLADCQFACSYCERRFINKGNMNRHIKSAHLNKGVKSFQCDRCEKAFMRKRSLDTHVRVIHDKMGPLRIFPCTYCGKAFGAKNLMQSHVRTHTGEKPFKCSKCPASFRQNGSLYNHNKLVHLGLTRKGTPKEGRSRQEHYNSSL